MTAKLRTHCRNNHEYTPENTKLTGQAGGRVVRQCQACRAVSDQIKLVKMRERRRSVREARQKVRAKLDAWVDEVAVERACKGFPVGRELTPAERQLMVERTRNVPLSELADRTGIDFRVLSKWRERYASAA